jgi:two-component sensor histidine kinase
MDPRISQIEPDLPGGDRSLFAESFDLTPAAADRIRGLDARDHIARAYGGRWLALLEQASCLIAVTSGPRHILAFANAACRRRLDVTEVIGRPAGEVAAALGGGAFAARLDAVYQTGLAERPGAEAVAARRGAGEPPGPLYLDFVLQPILDGDGRASGVLIEGHDVTERVRVEQERTLLMDELNHRVKNTLATVVAMARLARKSAASLDGFADSLTRRIVAMSRTQDLLMAKATHAVPVRDVLALELAPYLIAGGPVQLTCEDMAIGADAAVHLSLIFHELLTNAAKYGALAHPEGRLTVRCARGPALAELAWCETAGRVLPPSGPPGFGSTLIERLARGLGGGVRLIRRDDGLDAVLSFAVRAPEADEVDPQRPAPPGG